MGKILSDHKKDKKKLITPLNLLGIQEVNYSNEIIPNLIWLDLLFRKYGMAETIHIVEHLVDAFKPIITSTRTHFNCCILSNYPELTENEKTQILACDHFKKIQKKLNGALIGFRYYYPQIPINFLLNEDISPNPNFIVLLKESLRILFDQSSINTVFSLASVAYSHGIQGKLNMPKELAAGYDLNAIVEYPKTERSRQSAALIKTLAKMLIYNMSEAEYKSSWADYFWKQSLEIEPCTLNMDTDIEP